MEAITNYLKILNVNIEGAQNRKLRRGNIRGGQATLGDVNIRAVVLSLYAMMILACRLLGTNADSAVNRRGMI